MSYFNQVSNQHIIGIKVLFKTLTPSLHDLQQHVHDGGQGYMPSLLLLGAGGLSYHADEHVGGEQAGVRWVCHGALLVQGD